MRLFDLAIWIYKDFFLLENLNMKNQFFMIDNEAEMSSFALLEIIIFFFVKWKSNLLIFSPIKGLSILPIIGN